MFAPPNRNIVPVPMNAAKCKHDIPVCSRVYSIIYSRPIQQSKSTHARTMCTA